MRLNPLDPLGLPLGSKALAFCRLAYRTVPLVAVLPVIRMTVSAMRFLGVHVADGSRVFARILRHGQRLNVLRVYAGAIAASMVCDHPGRDRAASKKCGHARRSPRRSTECDGAVPVPVFRPLPFVAVADSLPLGIKSLNLCFGRWVHLALLSMVTAEQKVSAVLFGAQ